MLEIQKTLFNKAYRPSDDRYIQYSQIAGWMDGWKHKF